MGKQANIKHLRRTVNAGVVAAAPHYLNSLSRRNTRRATGKPPVNASVGRGRKSRTIPIFTVDGERVGQTHIRGQDPGFPPGRAPRQFRGCQSPRAVSRRAAKAARAVESPAMVEGR